MASESFAGFQAGSSATAVPNPFFTVLLPEITDPAELTVSLYLFFVLGRRRGNPRLISRAELAGERPLMRALTRSPGGAELALDHGLALAVGRGTLLGRRAAGGGDTVYALNTDSARRWWAENSGSVPPPADAGETATSFHSSILALYEENIGPLQPLLIDELEEAASTYSYAWIDAAFRIAVGNNRRNWRYISRILERWKLEGPDYETSGGPAERNSRNGRRTIGGPYRRVLERGGGDGG